MKVKLKPTSMIIADLGLEDKGPIHQFFTNTCALHMDKYVPFDTGAMAETVVTKSGTINKENVYENAIVYNQEYAIYPYYAVNMTIHQDKHRQACPYWDQQMWSTEKDIVVREVQKEINRRGRK